MKPRPLWFLLPPTLLALTLGLLTVPGGFVFDDFQAITQDERIRSLSNLPSILLDNYWGDFAQGGLYRPLTLASFTVEHALWGQNPAGYHVTNALFYALCAALLTLLANRLGLSKLAAMGTGLLFAAHPIHVEAVAPVVGRSELGAAAFALLALCLATRRARTWSNAGLTALAVFLALGFKEIAIAVIPALVLVPYFLDSAPEGQSFSERAKTAVQQIAKGVATHGRTWAWIGLALVLWFSLRAGAIEGTMEVDSLNNVLSERGAGGRLAGALDVTCRYHRMALLPWPLSADYSLQALVPSDSWAGPRVWLGLILGMALIGAMAWGIVQRSLVGLGLCIYGAALFPVSNLPFAIGTIFAERLLFFPSLGVCLAVVAALAPRHERKLGVQAGIALAVLVGSILFGIRVPDWRSELSITRAMVETQPTSAKAQGKYGWELFKEANDWPESPRKDEQIQRAREHLERANELYADFDDSHLNLSIVYDALGRYEDAAREAEIALRLAPRQRNSLAAAARASVRLENYDRAVELCNQGLKLYPGNAGLLRIRGSAWQELGQPGKAAADLAEAWRDDPNDVVLTLNFLRNLALSGNSAYAREVLNEILSRPVASLAPDFRSELPAFRNNRGLLRAREGDHAGAVEDYDEALRLIPTFDQARGNRARSLIELEQWARAEEDLKVIEERRGPEATQQLRAFLNERRQP